MGSLSDAKKRDFVTQIISLTSENVERLNAKGFNPGNAIEELSAKKKLADKAENAQQESIAATKAATTLAQDSLDEAYRAASNQVDLISGLLGKEDELVKQMRKFRK